MQPVPNNLPDAARIILLLKPGDASVPNQLQWSNCAICTLLMDGRMCVCDVCGKER